MKGVAHLSVVLVLALTLLACGGRSTRHFSTAVFEADLSNSVGADVDNIMDSSKQVVEQRVFAFGFDGAEVARDGNRLVVRLPEAGREEAEKLVKQGLLEFRELQRDDQGMVTVVRNGESMLVPLHDVQLEEAVWVSATAIGADGTKTSLTGALLSEAYAAKGQAGQIVVELRFNEEGAHLMEQITARLVDQPLAFFLDGQPLRDPKGEIIAPRVMAVVSDRAQITGLSQESAIFLGKILESGALPVPFELVSYEAPPE